MQRYTETLDTFAEHLREPRTARELAELARCSKPTVYARLAELAGRGVPVQRRRQRRGERPPGATGPRAYLYVVEPRWFLARDRNRAKRARCLPPTSCVF
jgi:predicted transcriptional regulator